MSVPKDRKSFLALLRSEFEYKGTDDLAAVKKFLTDEGHSVVDEDGNPLDLETIWAKTGAKSIRFDNKATETKAQTEDRLAGNQPAKTEPKVNKAAAVDAKIEGSSGTYRFGDAISGMKRAYDQRVKMAGAIPASKRPVFADADMAESCTAYLRAANALVNKSHYTRLDEDLEICEKAGSAVNMTTGGAFVPNDFRAQLIDLSEQYGVARRLATVVPMSRDTATYPRRTGRFTFSFSGENTAATPAEVGSDRVELTAKKAIGLAQLPSELMEDAAISVADFYARGFAEGIAYIEDYCYLRGDGTSTYPFLGVFNAPWFSSTAQGTSNTWTTQVEADINALCARPDNVNAKNEAFVCSRQYYFTVMMPMTAASGRGTINEFLTVNGTGGSADAQWRGWPVYFSQVMPTVTATTGTMLLFGDFAAATMFGDRKEMMIATSTDRYFDADQVAIRATSRFAITCHGDGRGSTNGPISGLKTG